MSRLHSFVPLLPPLPEEEPLAPDPELCAGSGSPEDPQHEQRNSEKRCDGKRVLKRHLHLRGAEAGKETDQGLGYPLAKKKTTAFHALPAQHNYAKMNFFGSICPSPATTSPVNPVSERKA